jgi:hypothetical protein
MLQKTDIVYISGPMSGLPDFNKPKFREIEHALQHLYGCIVLSPARHPKGLKYSDYMEMAKVDVSVCTVLLSIEGYEDPPGATFERILALSQNKKIIYEREICKN